MRFYIGQQVSIDSDNEEYGRVTGRATILSIGRDATPTLLVNAHDIQANIIVLQEDATPDKYDTL